MANLFDAANAPTGIPDSFVLGDYVIFKRTDLGSDYPPASYTATLVARIATGNSTEFQVQATASGSDFLFTISSATTAGYTAGDYHWQLEIVQNSSSNRIVVDHGLLTVKGDLDINGTDPRSHADVMVAKIESILSGKADADVSSYSVAGRSLTKLSFQELLDARDYYQREVNKERVADRINKGENTGSTVKVRFGSY